MLTSTRPCTDISQLPKLFVLISPRGVPACCSSSLLALNRAETKMSTAKKAAHYTAREPPHPCARDSGHFQLRPSDDQRGVTTFDL
jgi:hypothetical protein